MAGRPTRHLSRESNGTRLRGEPCSDGPETAALSAFPLESNAARRAVTANADLRAITTRPVDTAEVDGEVAALQRNRGASTKSAARRGVRVPRRGGHRTRVRPRRVRGPRRRRGGAVLPLDSPEAIDSRRTAESIRYLSTYTSRLIVALLPEDDDAIDDTYQRVSDI